MEDGEGERGGARFSELEQNTKVLGRGALGCAFPFSSPYFMNRTHFSSVLPFSLLDVHIYGSFAFGRVYLCYWWSSLCMGPQVPPIGREHPIEAEGSGSAARERAGRPRFTWRQHSTRRIVFAVAVRNRERRAAAEHQHRREMRSLDVGVVRRKGEGLVNTGMDPHAQLPR